MIGAKHRTEDADHLVYDKSQIIAENTRRFTQIHIRVHPREFMRASASRRRRDGGRRAFQSAMKVKGRPILERLEVKMLARVTAMRVRFSHAERSRFPSQWRSAKG